MKHLFGLGLIVASLLLAPPAGAVTFFSIQSESFANFGAGPDGRWGTGDDVASPGFNSLGHANQNFVLDNTGALVAAGAGPWRADVPGQSTPDELGTFSYSVQGSDPDFGTTTVDDPTVSPTLITLNADDTFDYSNTLVTCLGPAGCATPLTTVTFNSDNAVAVGWTVDDDPAAIAALTGSILGDLSDYALFLESLAPPDATAFSINIGGVDLTPDNISGSLVMDSWFGGFLGFSQALYTTDPLSSPGTGTPIIPEPTTAALLSLGLVGLAARRRRSA